MYVVCDNFSLRVFSPPFFVFLVFSFVLTMLFSHTDLTLANCIEVHKTITADFNDSAAADAYKTKCADLFPLSTYFGTGCAKYITVDEAPTVEE